MRHNLRGNFDEILRALLERYPSYEGNDVRGPRLLTAVIGHGVPVIHTVVNDLHFVRGDTVMALDGAFGEIAYGDNLVGLLESKTLNLIDLRMHKEPAPIVLQAVNMHDEGLPVFSASATPAGKVIQSCA